MSSSNQGFVFRFGASEATENSDATTWVFPDTKKDTKENEQTSQDNRHAGLHRATFFRSSLEPDVVVVVGGKEFREYSQSLCSWSDYFDAALRSGMKETKTMKFEFPDRDPEEWELIIALMAPMATEKVTDTNVLTALSWLDELSSKPGLLECDKVFSSKVIFPLMLSNNLVSMNGQTIN